jgi:TrmH family RNA methyltransferase
MITNQEIKTIQSLHKKKFRKELNLFMLEGRKVLEEALENQPDWIQHIYALDSEKESLETLAIPITYITARELSKISALQHPQGIVAVCKITENKAKQTSFQLALDTVQDPGNMGTILRLASWFGVDEVLLSEDCVDIYNPKVVQASMGAVFSVPIRYADLSAEISTAQKPIYGALLEGANVYTNALNPACILLMGNEGNGISPALQKLISHPISIPKFGKGESLNVAMATGILLSEIRRGG